MQAESDIRQTAHRSHIVTPKYFIRSQMETASENQSHMSLFKFHAELGSLSSGTKF